MEKKQELPKQFNGFTKAPNALLCFPYLTSKELHLYLALKSFAFNDNTFACPSQATLAKMIGSRRETVNRLLKRLRDKELISWEEPSYMKANTYELIHIENISKLVIQKLRLENPTPVILGSQEAVTSRSHISVTPRSHPRVTSGSHEKQIRLLIQLLRARIVSLQPQKFHPETIQLAKDLGSNKPNHLLFYEKIVNLVSKGILTEEDIQTTLRRTLDHDNTLNKDFGKSRLNKGAYFNKLISILILKRRGRLIKKLHMKK